MVTSIYFKWRSGKRERERARVRERDANQIILIIEREIDANKQF